MSGSAERISPLASEDQLPLTEGFALKPGELLALAADGQALDTCLLGVTAAVGRLHPRTRACVLLADETCGTLIGCVSAQMPPRFTQAMLGTAVSDLVIGPRERATCFEAPIASVDLAEDTRWGPAWRHHCLDHGVRACHFQPVRSGMGEPLGILVLCFDRARAAYPEELEVAEFCARVAALAIECTRNDRRREEESARRTFLLELNDRVLRQESAEGVMAETARALGERLGAGRIVYAEIDQDRGLAIVRGRWSNGALPDLPDCVGLSDFAPIVDMLRRGRTLRIADTHADPGLAPVRAALDGFGARALVSVPLIVDGRLLANLNVHQSTPRSWTDPEVALVEAVAWRTWEAVKRAQAEAALRASEARFRALATATSHVVYRMGPDWRELRRLDGAGFIADTTEATTDWVETYIPAEERDLVRTAIAAAVGSTGPLELEHRVIRADGGVGWALSRAVPVLDDAGRITEWFGVASDVTPRRAAAVALAAREEEARTAYLQLNAMLKALPVGVAVFDETLRYVHVNERLADFNGMPAGDHPGRTLQEVAPDVAAAVEPVFHQVLATGDPLVDFEFEAETPAGGGPRVWLENASVIVDPSGQRRWLLVSVLDITRRRRAEEALAASEARLAAHRDELERLVEERSVALLREVDERRRAEEALRQGEKLQALGQLVGGVAHDFNNLLQVVSSGLSLLRDSFGNEGRRELILQGMGQAAARASELTRQLLTFARRQALRPTVFDVNARLRGMLALLDHSLGARVRIVTDLQPGLWLVEADAGQLEIALLNLAVNARDAMPAGGTLTLRTRNAVLEAVGERLAGRYVCLEVSDTGAGMTAEVRRRLFEPFFTTKAEGRGTGLGLAQVYGFLKQSGGDVAVESAPGHGASFRLYLPVSGTRPRTIDPSPAADNTDEGRGRTVLVAEDNPDIARFARAALEERGWRTMGAISAQDALDRVGQGGVDAVFSDIVMPGPMNGLALAATLRARFPTVGIVLTTGYSEAIAAGESTADVEVLQKPYQIGRLSAALERALAGATK